MGPNELAEWLKFLNEGGPLAILAAIVGAVFWAMKTSKPSQEQSPPATRADVEKVGAKVEEIAARVSHIEGWREGMEGQAKK